MKFEKVMKEQFIKDFVDAFESANLKYCIDESFSHIGAEALAEEIYVKLEKPERSTVGSAAYDFKYPISLFIKNFPVRIPTGFKWNPGATKPDFSDKRVVLQLFPRSSLGFFYGLKEPNVVSLIDSDYYNNPSNEGHIYVNLQATQDCYIPEGTGYIQGVVSDYHVMEDDITFKKRTTASSMKFPRKFIYDPSMDV